MHDGQPTEHEIAELNKAISLGYDHRDLPWNAVGKGIGAFFVLTAVLSTIAFFSLWITMRLIGVDRPPFVPQQEATKNKPVLAPLQDNVTAKKDMSDLRKMEAEKLNSYGNIDGQPGKVHIPVERAMEMMSGSSATGAPQSVPTPDMPGTPEGATL